MKLVSTYPFDQKQLAEMDSKGITVKLFKGEQDLIQSDEYTDADIIIANHRTLQQDFLEKCEKVKWVQVAHIGIERLPMDYLKERGVTVINARGSLGLPIAEDILCKMLMLSRKSVRVVKNQFDHIWGNTGGGFINLYGKTAGIIGAGDVGTETAIRARAFGMKVIGINTTGNELPEFDAMYKPEQLNEVIAQSDYIILTLPLTDQSVNLLGEEQFKLMKPTAFIINISRGALINEEILLDYLQNKKIAGAGLDVFVEEFKLGKLPAESPFWELDNVLITPHCAGGGDQFHQRFSAGFMHNLDLFLQGKADEMINVRQFGKGY
ncbi:D-2-hydroxyacid dehydrogenase [Paenibacillus radicis (ex Xue et al. 2023)]|uniref:D-2-hydroxyacid dehydrogenase n=1 Tax=Paenibacillus radicis (ex Xue et al. 2023) TaxID=2972489 RepID=A0ABT1YRC6_9BACL|nr:D-2-hydroxyacid dehydrogenase [Paenibacillus radicis (ex Xue et al. 2023)]MCR8635285.1 D-2-hydroxyacid dehydrogenase [Paenibacillus radicis (ex Xue et al. 2023)]